MIRHLGLIVAKVELYYVESKRGFRFIPFYVKIIVLFCKINKKKILLLEELNNISDG